MCFWKLISRSCFCAENLVLSVTCPWKALSCPLMSPASAFVLRMWAALLVGWEFQVLLNSFPVHAEANFLELLILLHQVSVTSLGAICFLSCLEVLLWLKTCLILWLTSPQLATFSLHRLPLRPPLLVSAEAGQPFPGILEMPFLPGLPLSSALGFKTLSSCVCFPDSLLGLKSFLSPYSQSSLSLCLIATFLIPSENHHLYGAMQYSCDYWHVGIWVYLLFC